jgi:tetratricopeptide (TPR) repeat protein
MKQRRERASAATSASPETTDPFAAAAAELRARRPLRSGRLRQIVSNPQNAAIAEQELQAYLAGHPDDADALSLLAQISARLGRRSEALSLWRRCLERAPDFASARFDLANLLVQSNKFGEALAETERLLGEDDGNPLFRRLKANILGMIGEDAPSLAIYEDLAADNPPQAEFWLSYGHALRAIGGQAKSIAAYRKALEFRPSCGLAYWSLAHLKTFRFDDADIAAMQDQLKRADISADDRVTLQFALGKADEDRGAYERSFEHYAKANAAMRLRIDYDIEGVASGVARNKAVFTPEFLKSRSGAGCPAPDPIFVLGLPRSGTTLVEQVLSSHSAIEGTAELPYIPALAAQLAEEKGGGRRADTLDVLGKLEPAALAALGEEYLESARLHRKLGRPFFIDKKPRNFLHIGLIHLILPNAKIIDVRRHPVACCLSTFKSYFSSAHPRLAELGQFYRHYVELTAHFDRVLPGRVHRIVYETLVADPEGEVRRLFDYLGLPFEERCLHFYETERAVRTPSAEQVRRPIYTDALDNWRHYEPWLGPLIKSLGSALTRYPEVPEDLR